MQCFWVMCSVKQPTSDIGPRANVYTVYESSIENIPHWDKSCHGHRTLMHDNTTWSPWRRGTFLREDNWKSREYGVPETVSLWRETNESGGKRSTLWRENSWNMWQTRHMMAGNNWTMLHYGYKQHIMAVKTLEHVMDAARTRQRETPGTATEAAY